jgi:hypothetical protein
MTVSGVQGQPDVFVVREGFLRELQTQVTWYGIRAAVEVVEVVEGE